MSSDALKVDRVVEDDRSWNVDHIQCGSEALFDSQSDAELIRYSNIESLMMRSNDRNVTIISKQGALIEMRIAKQKGTDKAPLVDLCAVLLRSLFHEVEGMQKEEMEKIKEAHNKQILQMGRALQAQIAVSKADIAKLRGEVQDRQKREEVLISEKESVVRECNKLQAFIDSLRRKSDLNLKKKEKQLTAMQQRERELQQRCDAFPEYRESQEVQDEVVSLLRTLAENRESQETELTTPSLDELKQEITNGLNVVAAEYEAISEAQKQFGITEIVAEEYEAMRETQKEFGGIEAVKYEAVTETKREIKESECFISPKIAAEHAASIALLESELLVEKQKEDIEGLKKKMEGMKNQINIEITNGLSAVAAEYEATIEAQKEFGITEVIAAEYEAMMKTQKEFGSTEAAEYGAITERQRTMKESEFLSRFLIKYNLSLIPLQTAPK